MSKFSPLQEVFFPNRPKHTHVSILTLLEEPNADTMASIIKSGKSPKSLKGRKLGDKGAKVLANALLSGNAPQGLHLDLSDNNISDEGALALANALMNGKAPKGLKLDLSFNKISDAGTIAFAHALESGNAPQELEINLSNNEIRKSEVIALMKAINSGKAPTGLRIDLTNNHIEERVIGIILKGLKNGNPPTGCNINLGLYSVMKPQVAEILIECFQFIREGNQEAVKTLLANKNLTALEKEMALYRGVKIACKHNNIAMIEYLISQGAKLDYKDDDETPLLIACEKGHLEIAQYLLDNGADVNSYNENNETPLFLAAKNGYTLVAKYLIRNGANIFVARKDGTLPIIVASKNAHPQMVELLNHAHTALTGEAKKSALYLALKIACNQNNIANVISLKKQGACLDSPCDSEAPLLIACERGDVEIAKFLLEKGVTVNAKNKEGLIAPLVASTHGHTEIVRLFAEYYFRLAESKKTENLLTEAYDNYIHAINLNPEYVEAYYQLALIKEELKDFKGAIADYDQMLLIDPNNKIAFENRFKLIKKLCDPDFEWNWLLNQIRNNCLKLTNINLSHKNLNEEQIKSLCEALKDNHIASNIDLSSNVFTETGINALCAMLKINRTITELNLSGNKISLDGISALGAALEKNNALTNLKVDHPHEIDYQQKKLKAEQSVLIRVWPPHDNKSGESTSYACALFKSLFRTDINVGHISISIRNGADELYISHWPSEEPRSFKSVSAVNSTLKSDLTNENCLPTKQIMLYSLDTQKMIETYKEISKEARWFMFGSKNKKWSSDNDYNCCSYVHKILEAGGFFKYLTTEKHKLSYPMRPMALGNVTETAQNVERVLYPSTEAFVTTNLQTFLQDLLDASNSLFAEQKVMNYLDRNPDLYLLCYSKNIPEFKKTLDTVINNIQKSNNKLLLELIKNADKFSQKTLINDMMLLINKGSNCQATQNGYNALHYAIINGNYDCVKILLDTFPSLINVEIVDANFNNNQNIKSENSPYVKSSLFKDNDKVLPPITPLDLAIENKKFDIINLLHKRGAVTKTRTFLESNDTKQKLAFGRNISA